MRYNKIGFIDYLMVEKDNINIYNTWTKLFLPVAAHQDLYIQDLFKNSLAVNVVERTRA